MSARPATVLSQESGRKEDGKWMDWRDGCAGNAHDALPEAGGSRHRAEGQTALSSSKQHRVRVAESNVASGCHRAWLNYRRAGYARAGAANQIAAAACLMQTPKSLALLTLRPIGGATSPGVAIAPAQTTPMRAIAAKQGRGSEGFSRGGPNASRLFRALNFSCGQKNRVGTELLPDLMGK